MSREQNPGEEGPKKMMEKTNGEEAVTADRPTETCWFQPKTGSVIPKKRRLVISMMLDFARLKLTGSASAAASASAEYSATGETKRVYPHSPETGN